MRLNIIGMGVTFAIFCAGAMLVVGSVNVIWPTYGRAFLEVAASIFPGYHPGRTFGPVITGTLYGLVDGGIAGALFGWLYNVASCDRTHRAA